MKRFAKRFLILCTTVMLLSLFFLCSCSYGDYLKNVLADGGFEKLTDATDATDAQTHVQDPNKNEDVTDSTLTTPSIIDASDDIGDLSSATTRGLRSTVSISSTFSVTVYGGSYFNPQPTTRTATAAGSGVIYRLYEDGSAFILTNYHVVQYDNSNTEEGISENIELFLYGKEYPSFAIPATYVGGSPYYDIAVLRVDQSPVLKAAIESGAAVQATIGDSDLISAGDVTIAIGNPSSEGLGGISATRGIVSVESEYIAMTISEYAGTSELRVIRTDTPINAGNSGGGLFDSSGRLVGIVNAKISSTKIENIGYAIPSRIARAVADNIIDNCYLKEGTRVVRALLGIELKVTDVNTTYLEDSGKIMIRETVLVNSVGSTSPVLNLVQENDMILSLSINDRDIPVIRKHNIIDAMLDIRSGDTVTLKLQRNGESLTVSVTLNADNMVST